MGTSDSVAVRGAKRVPVATTASMRTTSAPSRAVAAGAAAGAAAMTGCRSVGQEAAATAASGRAKRPESVEGEGMVTPCDQLTSRRKSAVAFSTPMTGPRPVAAARFRFTPAAPPS